MSLSFVSGVHGGFQYVTPAPLKQESCPEHALQCSYSQFSESDSGYSSTTLLCTLEAVYVFGIIEHIPCGHKATGSRLRRLYAGSIVLKRHVATPSVRHNKEPNMKSVSVRHERECFILFVIR